MTAQQIADELVRVAPSGKVAVKGLGVFHVRDRRRYRRGIGVLFVLAEPMRAVLAGDGAADGLEGLAAEVAEAVRKNRPLVLPALGTFRAVTTTKKNLVEHDGSVREMNPRPAIAFEPSAALRERLAAAVPA